MCTTTEKAPKSIYGGIQWVLDQIIRAIPSDYIDIWESLRFTSAEQILEESECLTVGFLQMTDIWESPRSTNVEDILEESECLTMGRIGLGKATHGYVQGFSAFTLLCQGIKGLGRI